MGLNTRITATAVFWDIGGVILDLDSVREGHKRFIEDIWESYSLDMDRDSALEQWRSTVGAHFRAREGTNYRSAREGYEKGLHTIVGKPLPEEDWYPPFRSAVRGSIEANPGAIEVIRALTDKPIHLGIISDIDTVEATLILETFGISESFDSLTTSEAVGRSKPDEAMFETALGSAEVAPGLSIMIGDRYEHDMLGAHRCGMNTISYGAGSGPAVDLEIDDLEKIPRILEVPTT